MKIKIGKLKIEIGYNFNTNKRFSTNLVMYRKVINIFGKSFNIDFPVGILAN